MTLTNKLFLIMMKFYLLFLSIFVINTNMAQIGINTNIPLTGALHIDGMGNTRPASPSAETKDDVLINTEGCIAVGHVNPTTQLHIMSPQIDHGGIIIDDGTQGAYRLLSTDDFGNSIWAMAGESETIMGILPTNGMTYNVCKTGEDFSAYDLPTQSVSYPDVNTDIGRITNASISLPSGTWMVSCNMILNLIDAPSISLIEGVWIRTYFSETNTINSRITPDVLGADQISATAYREAYTNLAGFVVIKNSTDSPKVYYYHLALPSFIGTIPLSTKLNKFASKSIQENFIIATKMSD